jgi:hypothetical protein
VVDEDSWFSKHIVFAGYVPHSAVFEYYAKASLLLLILTNTKNAKGNIPGKVFEYIATGRRIIALGDPEGDTAQILRQAGAGDVFRHEDVEGVAAFLENFQSHRNTGDYQVAGKYDRKNLTGKLADLLDEISAGRRSEP